MLRYLVYVAALGLGACAGMHVAVPAALDPPAGQKLAMVLRAEGVQVYECRARREADGFEWAFVAPEADLFDRQGRRLGTHGAGPYWQAKDGSLVIGTVKARADAPARHAIPWLLMSASSGGPEGTLSSIASVKRLNTAGGVAPATGCGPDTRSKLARVPYTADYRMFAAR
jgi:hypothetical protein